jgi:uncharacterized protein YndB with AHSA1/START domain
VDVFFRRWTDPEQIKRWFGGAGARVIGVELDLKVGGHYRIITQPGDGVPSQVSGTYHTIEIPEKLVFTWTMVNANVQSGETLVTVTFQDLVGTTEVLLLHEPFHNTQVRTLHAQGWAVCLEAMAELI